MLDIEMNDEELFDLLCLQIFLTDQFVNRKIMARTLKKILFTTESLLEQDFIAFKQKEASLDLEYLRHTNPEYEKFEEILEDLADYVSDGVYTLQQIMLVIFGQHYIQDGKIMYSQN